MIYKALVSTTISEGHWTLKQNKFPEESRNMKFDNETKHFCHITTPAGDFENRCFTLEDSIVFEVFTYTCNYK